MGRHRGVERVADSLPSGATPLLRLPIRISGLRTGSLEVAAEMLSSVPRGIQHGAFNIDEEAG